MTRLLGLEGIAINRAASIGETDIAGASGSACKVMWTRTPDLLAGRE